MKSRFNSLNFSKYLLIECKNSCLALIIIVASTSIFLSSCSGDEIDLTNFLEAPDQPYQEQYELVLVDSFSIVVPDSADYNPHVKFIFSDSLLYTLSIRNKWSLDVYDLTNHKYVKRISFDPNFYKEDLDNFSLYDDKRILAIGSIPYINLYEISADGKPLKTIDFWKVSLFPSQVIGIYSAVNPSYFSGAFPLIVGENRVILSFTIPEAFEKYYPDVSKAAHTAIFNLETKKLEHYYETPENTYSRVKNSAYPTDLAFARKMLKGDTLLVTYPMDHYVYGYNVNSSELLFKKPVSSKYVNKLPAPLSRSEYNDREVSWDYRISVPFYEGINYHSELNLYTRVIHHDQVARMPDGKRNKGENRRSSIIILDKNFEKVGETLIEKSQFGVFKNLAVANGFYVGPDQVHHKSDDEFIIKYKYELRKVEE